MRPEHEANGFAEATEGFRGELLAHCYRLLGSPDEAEDLVQETYLKAWRGYAEFEGRSSVRTWRRERARAPRSRRRARRSRATAEQRAQLNAFMMAFETADMAALERLLRADAALEIPPARTWFSGRAACLPVLAEAVGAPGDWALIATSANGQPAAASYVRDDRGVHRAFGLAVLTTTATGIARIVSYADPALVTRFGLPPTYGEGQR